LVLKVGNVADVLVCHERSLAIASIPAVREGDGERGRGGRERVDGWVGGWEGGRD